MTKKMSSVKDRVTKLVKANSRNEKKKNSHIRFISRLKIKKWVKHKR